MLAIDRSKFTPKLQQRKITNTNKQNKNNNNNNNIDDFPENFIKAIIFNHSMCPSGPFSFTKECAEKEGKGYSCPLINQSSAYFIDTHKHTHKLFDKWYSTIRFVEKITQIIHQIE